MDSINSNKDGADHIPPEFLQSQTSSKLLLFRSNLKVKAPSYFILQFISRLW